MSASLRALALAAVMTALSCGPLRASVVVRIETDIRHGPDELMRSVRVAVYSGFGRSRALKREQVLVIGTEPGTFRMPMRFGVLPLDNETTHLVTVEVTGCDDATCSSDDTPSARSHQLVVQRAIFSFIDGEQWELPLFLASICRDNTCTDPEQTCRPQDGRCGPARVDVRNPPSFDASTVPDAPVPDAPVPDARAMDAVVTDAVVTDTPVPDAQGMDTPAASVDSTGADAGIDARDASEPDGGIEAADAMFDARDVSGPDAGIDAPDAGVDVRDAAEVGVDTPLVDVLDAGTDARDASAPTDNPRVDADAPGDRPDAPPDVPPDVPLDVPQDVPSDVPLVTCGATTCRRGAECCTAVGACGCRNLTGLCLSTSLGCIL